MKNLFRLLAGSLLISTFVSSCKLDPPILPGQPGYVAATPPATGSTNSTGGTTGIGTSGSGTTGGSTSVSDAALTGTWTTQSTYPGTILNGKTTLSSSVTINFFDNITLNDATKTGVIAVSVSQGITDSLTYTSSKSGNNTYITLSSDPFFGSGGSLQVQVTKLTSTAMTWLAIDPVSEIAGGYTFQAELVVNFTK